MSKLSYELTFSVRFYLHFMVHFPLSKSGIHVSCEGPGLDLCIMLIFLALA